MVQWPKLLESAVYSMLSVDRLNSIKQILMRENSVSVGELSKIFGVSGETVRRDLGRISQEDPMVIRVHGGAYRVTADNDPPYDFRQTSKVDEKRRIAQTSFSYINDGDFMFLDSSTTTLYLSRLIAESGFKLTVITNSLGVVNELCHHENIRIICLGGKYTPDTHSFLGTTTVEELSSLFAAKSFVSCSGIDLDFGITHNSDGEAAVRRLMLTNSKKRYLLIDANKFGRCKTHKIISPGSIDAVFTNSDPGSEWREYFDSFNIRLEICD